MSFKVHGERDQQPAGAGPIGRGDAALERQRRLRRGRDSLAQVGGVIAGGHTHPARTVVSGKVAHVAVDVEDQPAGQVNDGQ